MLTTKGVYISAIWQLFPVLISIVQHLTMFLLPTSKTKRSGKRVVQLIYALTFFTATIPYASLLLENWDTPSALYDIFVPSTSPVTAENLILITRQFLQWDAVFIFSSGSLLTLWLANDVRQLLMLLAVNVILTLVAGPGTAFAAIMFWREGGVGRAATRKTA